MLTFGGENQLRKVTGFDLKLFQADESVALQFENIFFFLVPRYFEYIFALGVVDFLNIVVSVIEAIDELDGDPNSVLFFNDLDQLLLLIISQHNYYKNQALRFSYSPSCCRRSFSLLSLILE